MKKKLLVMTVMFFVASVISVQAETLRIGVAAMISPKETNRYYAEMVSYIGEKIGRKVEMVQRENYADMDSLLENGEVDAAFICAGPYVKDHEKFGVELLVAPQSYGKPFYHAYIIVHKDSNLKGLDDLRGKRFAFTDPKSNTGKLVPTFMIVKKFNLAPEKFFSEVIYTKSHDRSIEAVAKNLVDGASVDSLIYDYAVKKNPVYTSLTKVIEKSPPYGIPPVVVTKKIDPRLKQELKKAFLSMHKDQKGKAILDNIMVDRFIVPKDSDYDSVREMEKFISKTKK